MITVLKNLKLSSLLSSLLSVLFSSELSLFSSFSIFSSLERNRSIDNHTGQNILQQPLSFTHVSMLSPESHILRPAHIVISLSAPETPVKVSHFGSVIAILPHISARCLCRLISCCAGP